ncbi:Stp1/IreP family PP2C-type Ser/Thr phosphatase [Youxingia wuxianensis]|uniref:Stp1/IreP family PP2C-type Ser/Thr phosphatase n=1 Tax=Youxingia wuxianensis TaxID=2763678 RepID=A0A926ESY4_9FIRM|nr:Stp1/IreP family PP2C-type Ser/Thr phosphatase [Youxingia wuxianensis]MBC8585715.1 Stp1/IreP family PP2C-type Ser/Thr phosphatase [Youxingia wuxianensis]
MIKIYGGTDKGKIRAINQDAYTFKIIDDTTAYAVLCDGMGGESGGHIASSKAVEIISQALERGMGPQLAESSVKSLITTAIAAANAVVYDMACNDERLRGMGTTVIVCVVLGDMLFMAHAGDSRAYHILENGTIKALTRDHTVVQILLDNGEITKEEAKSHPKRHYITRALGVDSEIEVEYTEQNFTKGRLLLCSDGLYNFAAIEDHVDLINSCSTEQDIYLLIDEANKAGGADNITAVVIAR